MAWSISNSWRVGGRADGTPRRWLDVVTPLLGVLTLVLVMRPYLGPVHDARLYMAQALSSLEPGRFARDLHFAYGSQDHFTVFTLGYRYLVATLGMANGHLAAVTLGAILWLSGLFAIAWALFERRDERWFAVTGVVVLCPRFASVDFYKYGEAFATPRLFAEGLVMAALALWLRGRPRSCLCLLAAAVAVHPLWAACGVGLVAVLATLEHQQRLARLLPAAVIGAAICALALALAPRISARYDGAWFEAVALHNYFALVSRWGWKDFLQLAATLGVLAVTARFTSGAERRLAGGALLVTTVALVVSLLGVDLSRIVLLTNLQPWRALWLATVLANTFVPILLMRGVLAPWPARLLAAGVVLDAITTVYEPPTIAAATIVIVACACAAFADRWRGPLSRVAVRSLAVALMAASAISAVGLFYLSLRLDTGWPLHWARIGIALGASALIVWAIRREATAAGGLVALFLLGTSVALDDQRDSWNRFLFDGGSDAGLASFLAGAGTTFWEGDGGAEALWFRRRQPSYWSCMQGGEVMFSRPLAMEYSRRQKALTPLAAFDPDEPCGPGGGVRTTAPPDRGRLAAVCRALPDLDTIVLDHAIPGAAATVWHGPPEQGPPTAGQTMKHPSFYRFSCAALR